MTTASTANNSTRGERLRYEREELCITQQQLADELGVHQSFIAQVETNRRPFPLEREEDLIRIFTEVRRQREADLETMRECFDRVTDEEVARELARIRARRRR